MAAPEGLPSTPNPQQPESSPIPGASRLRLAGIVLVVVVGLTLAAGWATNTSAIWLAWLAIGLGFGLVAGSTRAIWLAVAAAVLAYPLAALLGRASSPPQPDPLIWAILVLVGSLIEVAGFAVGAAVAERRVGRTTVAAVVLGLLGGLIWVGYSGLLGSDEVLIAKTSWPYCDTPTSKFGWTYEAINYDQADDANFVLDSAGRCTSQGSKAGADVVTSDGIGIAGWYIPAASGADATAPTFIISPGWKSNKSEVLKYAPFFHDRFNLVLLDLRNEGRSGGSMSTFAANERMDVRAMVDWLERTKHPTWIGAMGNSMGASAVLGEAVGDQRIRALVLDSMHAKILNTFTDGVANERNLPGLPTAWAAVGLSWLRSGVDIPAADPVLAIARVGNRPVLLIHGTQDILDTVDHAAKPNYAAAQGAGVPVTIKYCQGGSHGALVDKCPADWQTWLDTFLATVPDLPAAGG